MRKSNVIPLHPPMGRWQIRHLLAAFLMLAFFFGGLFYVGQQAYACNARHGIFARTAFWFACVQGVEDEQ